MSWKADAAFFPPLLCLCVCASMSMHSYIMGWVHQKVFRAVAKMKGDEDEVRESDDREVSKEWLKIFLVWECFWGNWYLSNLASYSFSVRSRTFLMRSDWPGWRCWKRNPTTGCLVLRLDLSCCCCLQDLFTRCKLCAGLSPESLGVSEEFCCALPEAVSNVVITWCDSCVVNLSYQRNVFLVTMIWYMCFTCRRLWHGLWIAFFFFL